MNLRFRRLSLVFVFLLSCLAAELPSRPAEAGGLSTYLADALLDHAFLGSAYTPASTIYLALSTADPTADCSGVAEPTYTGYSRKAITFGAASSRSVTQSADVSFDADTSGTATVTHYAIYDASTAGNCLAEGALSASKDIVSGNTPSVASGQVVVSVSAGYVSDYLANKWLDFAFRNQAFTQATHLYLVLTTATISDSDTGSTITEPSGNDYSRLETDAWDAASARATQNTSTATFATPSGSWGTIVAAAVVDASSSGNLYVYDNGVTDQAVGADDTVQFAAGAFDVSLN